MIGTRGKQFFALSGLTALEALRQPVCLVLTLTTLAFIGVLPALLTHTLGEPDRLIRDSALALHFVCGLVLGCYAACATLSREINRGTAASILAKPVGRTTFFLAKYMGIALVMLIFSTLITLATVMSTRTVSEPYELDLWSLAGLLLPVLIAVAAAGLVNYVLRKPFVSSAFFLLLPLLALSFLGVGFIDAHGDLAPLRSSYTWAIVPASGLIAMAVLVIAAVAVALATRLDVVPTLVICSVLLLVGLMSDYLFGQAADTSIVADIAYRIVPNWQHFWAADALEGDTPFPLAYLWLAGRYAAAYLAGMLCLGTALFHHQEVKT